MTLASRSISCLARSFRNDAPILLPRLDRSRGSNVRLTAPDVPARNATEEVFQPGDCAAPGFLAPLAELRDQEGRQQDDARDEQPPRAERPRGRQDGMQQIAKRIVQEVDREGCSGKPSDGPQPSCERDFGEGEADDRAGEGNPDDEELGKTDDAAAEGN